MIKEKTTSKISEGEKTPKISLKSRIQYAFNTLPSDHVDYNAIINEKAKKQRNRMYNEIDKSRKKQCDVLTKSLNDSSKNYMWNNITSQNDAYALACNGKINEETLSVESGGAEKTLCETYKRVIESTYDRIRNQCRNFDEVKLGTYTENNVLKLKDPNKRRCVESNLELMAKQLPFKIDDPERDAGAIFHAVCDSIKINNEKQYKDIDFDESWHILADDRKNLKRRDKV